MKISTILTVILVSFALISQQSFAAKENFDRSKPHKATLEKPCDIKTPACKKAMKEKMMKKKQEQVNPQTRATDYNSSRSNKADSAKAELNDDKNSKLKKAKTKATDYNSSRSNRSTSSRAVNKEEKKDKKEDDN